MSRRAPNMSNNAAITTAHTLSLLGEYTHSLDSLPLDLSRSFGDLRELDAVLSLSMTTLTTKINQLTTMLEKNMMSKEDRLWLLVDIAEEAARLKAGNDDKIRVACYAADNIKGHKAHMKTLIEHVPDHDFGSIQLLGRKTVFPHVATRSYMPVGGTGEGGRRQRRAAYLSVGGVDASPNKRKRAGGRDEDPDVVGKTPRKERAGDGARQRNAARNKRVVERAASPTESLVSVASHLPTATQGGSATNGRTANGNANNKRSRATNNAHDASTQERAHQDLYSGPPSSSTTHPSLAIPFSNNISALNGVHVANGASEWTHGQLEGPGMPVARTVVSSTTVVETVDSAGDTVADVDAEGDDGRIYCFCNRPSFGDMIACDDPICEREWFHLPCVGLKEAPLGGWYCDTCRAKRARRNGRGGKKKTGGNRTNTRNTST